MKDFRLAQPGTTDELAALLAETKGTAALMAGGTDLLDELKSGVAGPDLVVDLQSVAGLAGIRREKAGLRIGSMTRIVDLAGNADVARDHPLLVEAALSLATPQLRNVGTVGGNLCQRPRCWYYRDPGVLCRKKGGFNCYAFQGRNKYHAIFGGDGCYIVFPSDLAPALISLGAQVTLGSVRGERTILLEDFYVLPAVDVRKETVLGQDEFLKSISVPAPKAGQKGIYLKLKERETWDFALTSAAVSGVVEGGAFAEIAIVMGGVAPIPWRMRKTEEAIRGRAVSEDLVTRAAEADLADATPLSENAYKSDLVLAALKTAVMAIFQSG